MTDLGSGSACSSEVDRAPYLIHGAGISNRGGTGVYIRRLLEGMAALNTRDVAVGIDGRAVSPRKAVESGWSPGQLEKLLQDNYVLPRLARRSGAELVHLPAFAGHVSRDVSCAVTVHDLAFMAVPEMFPFLRSVYYRLRFSRVARNANMVIVDSDFTGREAVRYLNLNPGSIRTVYLSTPVCEADEDPFRGVSGIDGPYLLFVGTIEPRKNVGALLEAWREIRSAHGEMRLVIAGRWGWGSRSLRESLVGETGVMWTGELPRHILNSAISGARLLVYPSVYEGFGLPPLEASSAGVPSVIGPAEALREVYGEVALSRAESNPESIAEAVLEALSTDFDPVSLREFASLFTNRKMASEVLGLYRETVK